MRFPQLLLVLALILSWTAGGYAMIQTISLEELTTEAEIIAVATLKMSSKLPKDKDGWVKIENTIVFSEVLKGSVKTGDEVVVETLEGMEDQAKFEPKARFIVFLNKVAGQNRYGTTNLIQGCWTLDADGKPLGMGTGTTRKQLEEVIQKTKGQKPKPQEAPQPAF